MVLMEGKATSSNSGSRCNLLLYLVPVGMLWLFLRLVLLMQSKGTSSKGPKLTHVLLVLVLPHFLVIVLLGLFGDHSRGGLRVAATVAIGIVSGLRVDDGLSRLLLIMLVVVEQPMVVVLVLLRHFGFGFAKESEITATN
uniref:Uncharacterized protein n=1 Tax=Opuntia streptacantha TaxID=393608 RepID=A0A7C8ZE49_OPUST